MVKEIRIEIIGRVQGVGFRGKVKKYADKHGLKGSIMNLFNGAVLIILQGDNKEMEDFIGWLRTNPGFSKIEEMNVVKGECYDTYDDFKIVKDNFFLVDKLKALKNLLKRVFNKKSQNFKIPKHIVIIPDGNRRWAKERNITPHFGHYKSGTYLSLKMLFQEAKNLGVKCVSIWGFSTENWKRIKEEREAIFDLLLGGVERFRKDALKDKIRFVHIGRKDRLPKKLIDALESLEKETSMFKNFKVQLCLDYGGRDEIIRAVNKILKSGKKEINEKSFKKYLDSELDPDLIIRTSGEKRLSGMMPFQGVYAELYFSNKYFPEFGPRELRKAIKEYGMRERRFGGN